MFSPSPQQISVHLVWGFAKKGNNQLNDFLVNDDKVIDLLPILYTIPLQLLAYHTALIKGNDVDKPRNLAKSVTVE